MKLYLEPNSTLFYINGKIGRLIIEEYRYTCHNCLIGYECNHFCDTAVMLCKYIYNPNEAPNSQFILLDKLRLDRSNVDHIKYKLRPIKVRSIYSHYYMNYKVSNSAHHNLNK